MFKGTTNEPVRLQKESAPSRADLSADRNRNVSDRPAVGILCCCRFNLHKERNGAQLINRDRSTVTDLSAVLPPLTPTHLKPKDKRAPTHLFSDQIPFLSRDCRRGSWFVCVFAQNMSFIISQVLIWKSTGTVSFRGCETGDICSVA